MAEDSKSGAPSKTAKATASDLKAAEQRVADLRRELADAQGELQANIFAGGGVPRMEVRVKPNSHIVHEGKSYHGSDYPLTHGDDAGETLTVEGPVALSLAMQGQVDILRSVGVEE